MDTEFELIEWIRDQGQSLPESLLMAVGDDCAVIDPSEAHRLVVTTDSLVEDVHFRRRWTSPFFLGRKALAVNLSDLAAMGATPYASFLNLSLPPELGNNYFRSFLRGFLDEARRWTCPLAGGNLAASNRVTVAVTAIGSVGHGEPVYRSGARPGDLIAVVGKLGSSRQGLEILQKEDPEIDSIETLDDLRTWAGSQARFDVLKSHLLPEPMLQASLWIKEQGLASSMIDVSDGLALDLTHILKRSSVGATLDLDSVLRTGADGAGADAICSGGEDYALLLCVRPKRAAHLEASYPGSLPDYEIIGRVQKGKPIILLEKGSRSERLRPKGFDHFS